MTSREISPPLQSLDRLGNAKLAHTSLIRRLSLGLIHCLSWGNWGPTLRVASFHLPLSLMSVAVVPRRMGPMKEESTSQEPTAVATPPAPAEWVIESEDFFMPCTTRPCSRVVKWSRLARTCGFGIAKSTQNGGSASVFRKLRMSPIPTPCSHRFRRSVAGLSWVSESAPARGTMVKVVKRHRSWGPSGTAEKVMTQARSFARSSTQPPTDPPADCTTGRLGAHRLLAGHQAPGSFGLQDDAG